VKDLLSIHDLTLDEVNAIFALAADLKARQKRGVPHPLLTRKTLAMIFEKPSLRTRVAFEVGMTQLGGHAIYLTPADIRLGQREKRLARWDEARALWEEAARSRHGFDPRPWEEIAKVHEHRQRDFAAARAVVEEALARARRHRASGRVLEALAPAFRRGSLAKIGHNRDALEAAFPKLPFTWLDVSAGNEFVFLLHRNDLL